MGKPPHGIGKEQYFRDRGYIIQGTVHVGVNDGTELGWYLEQEQTPVLGFEPLEDVFRQAQANFQEEIDAGLISLQSYALGSENCIRSINVPIKISDGTEHTGGASFLRELHPDPNYKNIQRPGEYAIYRFDYLAEKYTDDPFFNVARYDLLVIDVQGMELEVLEGFGLLLQYFSFLVVECSEMPLYEGEASAYDVIQFLAKQGFNQETPILSHNDILFLNKWRYRT